MDKIRWRKQTKKYGDTFWNLYVNEKKTDFRIFLPNRNNAKYPVIYGISAEKYVDIPYFNELSFAKNAAIVVYLERKKFGKSSTARDRFFQ